MLPKSFETPLENPSQFFLFPCQTSQSVINLQYLLYSKNLFFFPKITLCFIVIPSMIKWIKTPNRKTNQGTFTRIKNSKNPNKVYYFIFRAKLAFCQSINFNTAVAVNCCAFASILFLLLCFNVISFWVTGRC